MKCSKCGRKVISVVVVCDECRAEPEIVRCGECIKKGNPEFCPACKVDITGKAFMSWRLDDSGFCSRGIKSWESGGEND